MKGNRLSWGQLCERPRSFWRLGKLIRSLLISLGLFLVFACNSPEVSAATSEPVKITQGQSFERIESNAVYLSDELNSSRSIEQIIAAYEADEFEADFVSQTKASAFERGLWLALELEYAESQGLEPIRGEVGLGGIFVVHPEVYIVRDNEEPMEVLASLSGPKGQLKSRYFTYVRTASLDIKPGEKITAFIHTSRADRPTIGFFREGELGSNQVVATIIKAGFTIVLLFIGITLAVIAITTGRTIGLVIAGAYSLVMIQNDASLFTTSFIDSPWLARQVWEAITLASIFANYFAFVFSFRRELRLSDNKLLALGAVFLPMPLVIIAYNSDSTADILWAYYLSLFLMACTICFKFDIAPRLRVLAGVLVVGASVGAVATDPVYLGGTLPDLTLEFIRDLLRTMGAVALLILLLVDVLRSRRERIETAKERISALEAQAETDRKLLQAEREYARAREAAARRKAQLAAASHDIRQPIVGLRSALATEADNLTPSLRHRLGEAINYLENLTEEYSDRETPVVGNTQLEREEPYSLDLIARAVGNMFAAEAKESGVELSIDSTDRKTNVPALALIRATSNLVANALRHANARSVTVEITDVAMPEIIVSDDGHGMDANTLTAVQKRGSKGQNSEGDGLGLAIIHDLAERYQFNFKISSEPGHGTRAEIELPELSAQKI